MGEPWMIPTYNQCKELIDNTIFGLTGINSWVGYKFTSKIDTSKYIFLPTGGWWYDTTYAGFNSTGYYLSSTLRYPQSMWIIYFYNIHISIDNNPRDRGYSIRPVRQ